VVAFSTPSPFQLFPRWIRTSFETQAYPYWQTDKFKYSLDFRLVKKIIRLIIFEKILIMTPNKIKILEDLKNDLKSQLHSNLKDAVIYGSQLSYSQRSVSDFDILIIVKGK
jgi:hypothetical protein